MSAKNKGGGQERALVAKSSVLSELSGLELENVLFYDFIDDELDSEDASEHRASAKFCAETKISPKLYTPRGFPTIRGCLEGLALKV